MSVTGHTSDKNIAPPAGPPAAGVRKPASIRDVARVAGVSYQTVSRVINDHPSVKDETRGRVQAAIDALGFRRSATALALASGQTRAVTVLTSNTILFGYAATLQGLEEAARAAGYSLGVAVLTPEADMDRAIATAADGGGGLVVVGYDRLGAAALERVPADVACAAVLEAPAPGRVPSRPAVWADDRTAARKATEYLLSLGHRTVHYVALPASTGRAGSAGPRAQGWQSALQDAGITPPAPCGKGWDAQSGYDAGRRLADDPEVTAVLCGNDDLALGVMRALHQAGRSVPGEVSVVGFDNVPHAAFVTPTLSSVRMDFEGLGRSAFGLLRAQLETDFEPLGPAVGMPELIIRESSGPRPR